MKNTLFESIINVKGIGPKIKKKLEEKKYILGYHARINYEQLQKAHVAFVQVVLSDTRASALENFNREVSKLESIEQCHMIAGSFDYLLKVELKDKKYFIYCPLFINH